jgi:succinate dehydrogenase/fumarate reductase iron-sulfur protein
MKAKLKIYRFDPETDKEPRYDMFEIDAEEGETILTALLKVYENIDASLSFRFACGKIKCGECAMMVNKSPCLACNKKIEPEMIIEPLPNLPIIKDLVVDTTKAMNRIFELSPVLLNYKQAVGGLKKNKTAATDTYVKLTACFECLICQSVCPELRKYPDRFVGPLGLLWLAHMSLTATGDSKEIDDISQLCTGCERCWKACPSEVDFLKTAIKDVLNKQPPAKKSKK